VNVLVLVLMMSPTSRRCSASNSDGTLRAQRFVMDFASSAADALARIAATIEQIADPDPLGHQHAGMTGLEMLPNGQGESGPTCRSS